MTGLGLGIMGRRIFEGMKIKSVLIIFLRTQQDVQTEKFSREIRTAQKSLKFKMFKLNSLRFIKITANQWNAALIFSIGTKALPLYYCKWQELQRSGLTSLPHFLINSQPDCQKNYQFYFINITQNYLSLHLHCYSCNTG